MDRRPNGFQLKGAKREMTAYLLGPFGSLDFVDFFQGRRIDALQENVKG
jgi:hypothetical protein